jgi:hypothetical protein
MMLTYENFAVAWIYSLEVSCFAPVLYTIGRGHLELAIMNLVHTPICKLQSRSKV